MPYTEQSTRDCRDYRKVLNSQCDTPPRVLYADFNAQGTARTIIISQELWNMYNLM